jgi:hypothetical protein
MWCCNLPFFFFSNDKEKHFNVRDAISGQIVFLQIMFGLKVDTRSLTQKTSLIGGRGYNLGIILNTMTFTLLTLAR